MAWYQIHNGTKLPDPIDVLDTGMKWLSRSALQKAIRRGKLDESLRFASALYHIDRRYFWKSLATIAIEDVGVGNPEVVRKVFEVFVSSQVQKLFGENIACQLVTGMVESCKCRMACEISLGCDLSTKPEIWEVLLSQDDDGIVASACQPVNRIEDLLMLYRELHVLMGYKGGRGKNAHAVSQVVAHHTDSLADQEEVAMIKLLMPLKIDSMCQAVLPMCLAHDSQLQKEECFVEDDEFPPVVLIGGIPSYALDMHTQVGKKSLAALHTSLGKDYPEIKAIPREDCVKALGSVVFVLEGGQVSKRLTGRVYDRLKLFQDRSFMVGYGVPQDKLDRIVEIVKSEMPRLNQKREWAWGHA